MNKEERTVLAALNTELESRGMVERFSKNAIWPMRRTFLCELSDLVLVRYCTDMRELDIFTLPYKTAFAGNSVNLGKFTGRGWLKRLAEAAADAVEKEKSSVRQLNIRSS